MATTKYKVFEIILIDGTRLELRAPSARITERYATIAAPHWCKIQKGINNAQILSVKGIK